MTPLDAKRESKLRAIEEAEKIDAMGQESEIQAAKWVIEEGKKTEKESVEETARKLDRLHESRGKIFTYRTALLDIARDMLLEAREFLKRGYFFDAMLTDKGLVVWMRTPQGDWYAKGMVPSGVEKADLQSVDRLIAHALDRVDELEQEKEQNKII